ncbi:HAD family hydrolase [Streptococcus dentasini]
MLALYFDVDDTLYDQSVPFRRAFCKNFSFDIPIESLYKVSRRLSDTVFEPSENGQISMQEMHIYRIKEALKKFGYRISDEEALRFQKDYENYQKKITLSPQIKAMLAQLAESGVTLGVITNGPKGHQQQKIKQLGLQEWFLSERIIISSDVGVAKPDQAIFDLAYHAISLPLSQCYYIGDSFENDVKGAKGAGWKSIWFNRRDNSLFEGDLRPDKIVSSEEELAKTILGLVL